MICSFRVHRRNDADQSTLNRVAKINSGQADDQDGQSYRILPAHLVSPVEREARDSGVSSPVVPQARPNSTTRIPPIGLAVQVISTPAAMIANAIKLSLVIGIHPVW